jgi:hypothetical protein
MEKPLRLIGELGRFELRISNLYSYRLIGGWVPRLFVMIAIAPLAIGPSSPSASASGTTSPTQPSVAVELAYYLQRQN